MFRTDLDAVPIHVRALDKTMPPAIVEVGESEHPALIQLSEHEVNGPGVAPWRLSMLRRRDLPDVRFPGTHMDCE
jgi:hypothetical protein